MDHVLEHKMYNKNPLELSTGKSGHIARWRRLRYDAKGMILWENIDEMGCIKIKAFTLQKTLLRDWKDNL